MLFISSIASVIQPSSELSNYQNYQTKTPLFLDHVLIIPSFLTRLKNWFCLDGLSLDWFYSYLSLRSQAVSIDDSISAFSTLSCGVPQGSVLGPLLFTLYTTPLGSVISKNSLKYHLYADYTQLYISFTPTNSALSLETLTNNLTIVGSRLDYCNSLFSGTSVSNMARLQLVQNTLAQVFTENSRFCHITPVLSDLHWLPVCHRINFKIATITFKVLQFQQPSYLAALIPRYLSTRSLRSSSSLSICVPNRKTAEFKSFSSVASYIWNKLPGHLSSISTLPAFRKRLKHYLFSSAFPDNPSPSTAKAMSAHPQMQLRSDTPHRLANASQLSAYD